MRYAALLIVSVLAQAGAEQEPSSVKDAFAFNRMIGRGVNLGNMLEAPREGEWGAKVEERYFDEIQKAGFQSVRIPIRWSAHAKRTPPFAINPAFFERVDAIVQQALKRNLVVVLNVHHFDEIHREPEQNLPMLKAIWEQIGERYRKQPDRVAFEILNEPQGKLNDEAWNKMIPELLATIRVSNPDRIVIIGPSNWNNVDHLAKLKLPSDDRRIIGTFHYYQPFKFTHQGAHWVNGSAAWKGTKWTGGEKELGDLSRDFAKAAKWSKENNRPIYVGEFGAFSAADMASRARWTKAVVSAAEKNGFSFAYWEFCSGFGVYDSRANAWREPLKAALVAENAR